MEEDTKFYCVAAILAIAAMTSIFTLNAVVIIASLLIALLSVALYRLHYVIDSLIFKKTNLIQLMGDYELRGERTVAVRKLGGKFSATAAALLEANPKTGLEKEKIENIIASSHIPFKFVLQIETVNLEKLIDKLETSRGMKEIELGRMDHSKGNILKANSLRREIEQINQEILAIGTGGKPLRASQYIMTSSVSDSRFGAGERAKSQIRELSSQFSAMLGIKSSILSGNDLIDVLRFDSVVISNL
jgi:hypothetical protein